MEISTALDQLDAKNDEHWTSGGLPKMTVIETLVGDPSITRKDVEEARPDFNRGTASSTKPDPESVKDPDETVKRQQKELKKTRKAEAKRKRVAADKLAKKQGAAAKAVQETKDNEAAKIKATKKAEKQNAKKRKKGDPDIIVLAYDYPAIRVKAIARAVRKAYPEDCIHIQCSNAVHNGKPEKGDKPEDLLHDKNIHCIKKRVGVYMRSARYQVLNAKAFYLAERPIPQDDVERIVEQILKRK